MTNLYLSFGEVCSFRFIIQSFSPAQHVAIMSHTFPRLCQPNLCFHLEGFRDLLSSFLCVGIATMPYFSTFSFSSGYQSPHSMFDCRPTPWRATYFPHFFAQKWQFHLDTYLPGHNAGSCRSAREIHSATGKLCLPPWAEIQGCRTYCSSPSSCFHNCAVFSSSHQPTLLAVDYMSSKSFSEVQILCASALH